jgi:hypothetical protein
MNINELIDLYCKERDYQTQIFGSYESKKVLNISSFLTFIDNYLKKAKDNYCQPWVNIEDLRNSSEYNWFRNSIEMEMQGAAPVSVYEELIKIFVLAGAAIESYADINIDEWRNDGIKGKWSSGK